MAYLYVMANETLTAAQSKALASLREQAAIGFPVAKGSSGLAVATGVNTTVLHTLRAAGLITVRNIWLRGQVSPDIEVVG